MKVGLIVEGIPDAQVCEYLASRLNPDLEVETVPMRSKPWLLRRCGRTAKLLLNQGMDRVVVVWDLYPPQWENTDRKRQSRRRKTKHTCERDRESIVGALETAGVDRQKVCLVCINAMLETWLLSDMGAVNDVLSSKTRRSNAPEPSHLERNQDPKKLMINYFRQYGRGGNKEYNDVNHAIRIAKAIPEDSRGLNKLRKRDSFVDFERCILNKARAHNLGP